jgi:hypothetical protein
MRRLAGWTVWIAVMGVAVSVVPARATMMLRRLPLEAIAAGAARIVHGRVIDVVSGRDASGMPASWVTIDVDRPLKGASAGPLTIKQLGAMEPLPDGAVGAVAGLPRWRRGEEVVVFLRGESRRGFTSPVGLGQGVFRVRPVRGRRTVRSDTGEGAEELDAFLERVQKLAGDGR